MLRIGLEVHIRLSTASKLFCACPADLGQAPNTHCCPICLGLPGAWPTVNQAAVYKALQACWIVEAAIDRRSAFDRKHYAYPDMPKGYQITQQRRPIGRGGRLTDPGGAWSVGIRQLHLEEDAAKLIHDPDRQVTRVDYNRSGLPLLELVTEPDLRSADEAVACLTQLRQLLVHAGVTDGRMEAGSLRVDVNVSVQGGEEGAFTARVEVKNLNSLKAVHQAIVFEKTRLERLLQTGRPIPLQTRRWDERQKRTLVLRGKSSAATYRYLPEADLGYLELAADWVEAARASLPEEPHDKRMRYQLAYGLPARDGSQLVAEPALSHLFEQTVSLNGLPQQTAGWLLGPYRHALRDRQLLTADPAISPRQLADLITAVEDGTINRVTGERLLGLVMDRGEDPLDLVQSLNLHQVSDEQLLGDWVDRVIRDNPGAVSDWRQGKTKAWHFLIGQVMKQSGGKADVKTVEKRLKDHLQR